MSINNPRNNPNFALNQITLRGGSSLLIYLLIFCKVTACITHALERASGEAVRRNKRGRKRLVLIPYERRTAGSLSTVQCLRVTKQILRES